jgi:ankyrin repeat protein
MLAVEANSPSCIKWLLERGADPKVHLKTGWQALHLALRLGHDSCVLMLLQEVSGVYVLIMITQRRRQGNRVCLGGFGMLVLFVVE